MLSFPRIIQFDVDLLLIDRATSPLDVSHLAVVLPSPLLRSLLVELIRVDGYTQSFEVGDYPLILRPLYHIFLEVVCCALRLVSLGRG